MSTSTRKAVVETYVEGFRRSDHDRILACLIASLPCKRHRSDAQWRRTVVRDLTGHAHPDGKAAFDRDIGNEQFAGSPTLTVDRLIEEGATVVAIGIGETTHRSGQVHRFAFDDACTFAGEAIRRVESSVIPLAGAG